MTSEKSKTNKKWTSNDDYRNNYDAIFKKKKKVRKEVECWNCVNMGGCAMCGYSSVLTIEVDEEEQGNPNNQEKS